jgi:type II secretory pathway predicted ATPase ExeA
VFLSHFHLHTEPFAVALDPAFFFPGPDHREALATLYYVVREHRGGAVMLGETGVGKTLVVRYLKKLLGAGVSMMVLSGPMESADVLDSLCAELGIRGVEGRHRQLRAIEEAFAGRIGKGRRTVVAMDDADQLSFDALELVQILCGFETAQGKPFDLVLSGRPVLLRALAAPSLERLRQTLDASCRIAPLDPAGTAAYLEHRMRKAGARGSVFTAEAAELVAAVTRGVPRRINQLGHQVLAEAWSQGAGAVDEEVVWGVLYELPVPELLMAGPAVTAPRQLGDGRG